MKKLIAATIAIMLIIPKDALCLRPMAQKLSSQNSKDTLLERRRIRSAKEIKGVNKLAATVILSIGYDVFQLGIFNKPEAIYMFTKPESDQRAIGYLFKGKLLGFKGLTAAYKQLLSQHVQLDRTFFREAKYPKLSVEEVVHLDEERHRIHRQLVIIGYLLSKPPATVHYELILKLGNLSNLGLPGIGAEVRDKNSTILIFPMSEKAFFKDWTEYQDSSSWGEPELTNEGVAEGYRVLEEQIKERFKGEVVYRADTEEWGHNFWHRYYFCPSLIVPNRLLERVADLIKSIGKQYPITLSTSAETFSTLEARNAKIASTQKHRGYKEDLLKPVGVQYPVTSSTDAKITSTKEDKAELSNGIYKKESPHPQESGDSTSLGKNEEEFLRIKNTLKTLLENRTLNRQPMIGEPRAMDWIYSHGGLEVIKGAHRRILETLNQLEGMMHAGLDKEKALLLKPEIDYLVSINDFILNPTGGHMLDKDSIRQRMDLLIDYSNVRAIAARISSRLTPLIAIPSVSDNLREGRVAYTVITASA